MLIVMEHDSVMKTSKPVAFAGRRVVVNNWIEARIEDNKETAIDADDLTYTVVTCFRA